MRPMAERVINMGIRSQKNQATLMKIRGILKTPIAFKKLINDLVPRYRCRLYLITYNNSRNSLRGKVRITELLYSYHNAARMAIV